MQPSISAILLSMYALIAASPAKAGWHGCGGDLFTDVNNPWFLENTSEIRYCIKIDDQNFGQTLIEARKKIHAAFAYWQSEFASTADLPRIGHPPKPVRIATQDAVEVSCQDAPDVTFQLGVLSDEQAAFLQHPQKIVAHTVRTAYNPASLKGAGFIYVSPEQGRLALVGSGGDFGGAIIADRWRYAEGSLLELVLIHELGHIFGLQHLDGTVMAADFPSRMVSYPEGYAVTADISAPWFFMRKDDIFASTYHYDMGPDPLDPWNDTTKILDLPLHMRGLLELRPSPNGSLALVNLPAHDSPAQLVGTFIKAGEDDANYQSLITLFLTPAQPLFQGIPSIGIAESLHYIMGKERKLTYRSARGGTPRSIAVRLRGPSATFLGVNDRGHINLNFLEMENWSLDWRSLPERDSAGTGKIKPTSSRRK